jgi:hypothetical protein
MAFHADGICGLGKLQHGLLARTITILSAADSIKAMDDPMESAVIAALTRVGLMQTGPLVRTVALREGQVVAQKFLFDDGCAVWASPTGRLSIYDDSGCLLFTVNLQRHSGIAA